MGRPDGRGLVFKFPQTNDLKGMQHPESLRQTHRNQIRPIFEMLKHKKSEMDSGNWENLVRSTEQSILNAPDQYLSGSPDEYNSHSVIHSLFDEFLNELV